MKRKINILFIIKKHTLVISCFLFVFFANLRLSYSQNIVPAASYCNSDPPTPFKITTPTGKTWTCNVPGVIVNTFNGEAVFSPALVPGPYPRVITILYQKDNYIGEPAAAYDPANWHYRFFVTITTPPVVTFAAIADVCVNDPIFPLPPRGNPATGIYAGPGVDAGGFFHPAVAGAGTHSISYTYPTTGCNTIAYQMVTVRALPPVSLAPFSNMCIDAVPITLTTGSPGGGTYSGTGVVAGMFNPGAAGVGIHTITYTFSDGLCTSSASRTITVNALPAVTIGGLLAQQCDTDPAYPITGFPTSASGTFNGNGITDNNNGTAVFNPGNSGLGLHNIIYSYTDVNGCSNSNIQITRVGTELFMNGLTSNYCANEPVKSFTYTPANSTNPLNRVSGTGIIDNLDGTATFNPGIAAIGNNTITYTFWDDIGCENIITQNVFVADAPVADFSGLNASLKYCFGSIDVTLTGNHPGGSFTGPVGCIVDNGDGTAIFKPSVLTEGIYSIIYSYTNSSGCTDTETKNVEILPLPTNFNVTGGGAYCSGTGGNAVGLNSSTAGVNYQLFRDGFAVVSINIKAGDGNPVNFGNQTVSGAYTVVATNAVTACSSQMNGSVSISVTPQAAITSLPLNETVCENGSAIFTVTATGQGLNYAWTKNGAPYGGNSNILAVNGVTMADNGHLIVCTVTSTCPAGYSNTTTPVTLTVNPNSTITTHPSDIVKCTGTSHTFTVVATGLNNTYHWKNGATDIVDTPGKFVNANTANLTILNLTTSDAGNYICYVKGTCGPELQSNPALLTVDAPIVITTQPSSIIDCAGSNVAFSTVATGTSLSYQWWFDNDGAGPNPAVSVGTGPSLPRNSITAAYTGTYYCFISSPCGATSTTNSVTLSIPATTNIITPPTGGTICAGVNFNFSVVATGDNLQYEWYQGATKLTNGGVISNATTANLSLTGATLAYAGNYTVKVIGTCGTETSIPAAMLSVKIPVNFIGQPVNQTVCSGNDATFSVNVSGDVLSYEWQRNTVPVAGGTNFSYTVSGATAAEAGNYRCLITTSNCGSYYSNVATLTINPLTAITTQPMTPPKNSCAGSNVSFSVVASGVGLTYQWYKNNIILVGAAFRTKTITLNNITAASAGSYTCQVKGTCGPIVESQPVILTVDIPGVISNQPQSQSVCLSSYHELTVTLSSGTNAVYQWYFNGTPVGSNSSVYSISNFAVADAGNYYCTITNGCGTVTSQTVTLTLVNPFTITTQPADVNVCLNGTATFTVAASQPGVSYQWIKNTTTPIAGATASTLVINNVQLADDGSNYSCAITNSCGTTTSNGADLTVSTPITITQQPQSGAGCIGEALNIVTIATGTNLTYQWFKNGIAVGLDNPAYDIASFVAGDAGTYRCEITNGCGTVVSDNAVISLGVTTNITAHPVSAVRCIGSDVNFVVTANGSNLIYQWKKDGINLVDNARITATNTNSLSITGVLISDLGTYTCDVIGSCETETSNGAVLSVKNPVSITSQPDNQIVCNGSDAIFDVVATGDDLTYSWQKNGVAIIPAETSSSLILVGVNNSHEGVYNCRVSNSCSFEISTSADLIVDDNLIINTQPLTATQCQGTNVSFTVNVTGPPNTVYQWLKDGVAVVNNARISGANSAILNINAIVPTDNGSYSCRLTSSCGFDETDIAVLTVLENVTITVSPTSFSVLNGNSANFTVVAAGSITGYQWRKDGIDLTDGGNISGALTANLTIANTTAADQGAYTCYVTGSCNSIPSNPANLTVLASSAITIQPAPSVTICEGGTLNLFITTSGAGHSYQWKKDGVNVVNGGNISGAITSTLTVSNLITANQGAYTCLVDGIESSSPSVVVINPSTIITVQPIDATKCVNDNVNFVVVANGAGLTYQWQKNLTNIVGATNSNYIINPLVDGDDGVYTCIVTGVCGIKTSNPATLVVNKNTVINTHPAGTTICEGTTTSLSIVADGDNLTYQWKKNGSTISDAGNISGTNTNTLGISNALPADAGIYSCTVSGACGSETSNFATLVVNPTTLITLQPIGRTKCEGDNVVFTVNAAGANLVYQWKRNGVNVANDGNVMGALTGTLSIATISLVGHQGTYTCIVTGSCGIATSDPAVLTVSDVTTITAQPSPSITICQNASTSLSVVATGGNLTYQWRKNGFAISDAGNISGTTTNNLVISNALTSDAGFYNCTVTGACGSLTSDPATLQVNQTTIITMHPVGQTLCEGDNVQFMVSAVGYTPLTYQWKLNNVPILSANSSTLTINGITASDAGAYTCVVSGASTCGTSTSNPANLVINPKINITVQPINTTVCEDNVAIMSLSATGTNLTYKWKYNEAYISDNGRITGTGTNQLRIAFATKADEGIYKCELFSTCGALLSNSVILTVTDSTKITAHPLSQTLLQGSTATFNISATGAGLTYQWQKDNVDISGATSNSYSIAGVQPADAGSFRCIVKGNCGEIISKMAVLTVNQLVIISSQPATPPPLCVGQSASFSVGATGTIVSYQWQFNGSDIVDGSGITGAKTANLVISPVSTSHAGDYSCIVTGSNNIANSNAVKLTVNVPVTITNQPLTQTKCDGDILVLEVAPNDLSMTYNWEFNGNPLSNGGRISGADKYSLVITDVSNADAGSYRCNVSNVCTSVTSNPAIVTINPAFSITTNPSGLNQCEGQTAFFSVITNVSTVNYLWYLDGAPLSNTSRITGTNTANLIINNLVSTDQGSYSCLVSDNCSSKNSAEALLTVKKAMVITSQPSNSTVCEGMNSFFEVKATGDNLKYQWQKNGINLNDAVNIFGTKTSVLIIQNTTIADQGVYRCYLTSSCDTILTNTSNLSVNALPGAAGVISGNNIVCQGTKNVLYVVPAISNAETYVWDLPYGATIVSGSGTRSIQVNFSTFALSGVISVHGQNGCASGAESPLLPITVNSIPLAIAGADQTLCSNTTTFNANATAFGSWTRISGLATIANPNLPNSTITNLGQGNNLFVWTVTENGCVAKDSVIITNNIVNVDAGTDQTICSLTSKLNANIPVIGTGSWSIVSGGVLFSSISDPKTDIINLSRGTNILRWSINNGGCISHDDVIIINDLPTNANAGSDTILLVNNYILSGNTPAIGIGLWTLANGSGTITNPLSPTSSVTNLGIGENLLVWTITHNNCFSQDEVKVINYTPTLTSAGPDQTLCSDRTYLSGTMPNYGTGQWTVIQGSGTFVNSSKFDTEVIKIGKGINVFRWTIYEYKITFDDVTITNNSPTTANAGIDQRICTNQTILSGNQPIIGIPVWTIIGGSAVISDINKYNATITNLGYGSNMFRWTISNGACISTDEVVIINDRPTQPDAGVDQLTCADSVMLFPNTPSIGTGEWSVISGSANINGNKASGLAIEDNYLKWTISNNSCSLSDTVKITSHKPTTSYAGSDRSICGESIFLNANIPSIGTGNWVVLSGAATIADLSKNNTEVTNLNLGKNILRWIITYKECSISDDVTITNNRPVNFNAGTDQYLCANSTQLYASDPAGGFGRWSIASGSAAFSDNTLFNTTVSNLEKGANKLVWTLTIGGCSNSDTLIITNNLPSLPSAGPDQDNCSPESFMAANLPQIGTGKWSVVSGSATFENPANPYTKVTNAGNGSNLLRWTISNGSCDISDEMFLINSLPTLAYGGEDRVVCNNTANLLANPPTTGIGTWRVVSGFGVIANSNDYNTQINQLGFGPNTIRWTTESGRCRTSDDVIITNNLAEANAGLDEIIYTPVVTLIGNKPASGTGEWVLVAGNGTIETPSNFETRVSNLGEGANSFYWTINNDGCIAFDDVVITYYVLPTVNFIPTPQNGCPPLIVDFINGSVGGNPFTWEFGDGTTSTQTNPTHTYNVPGKYIATLTGTGPDGIMIKKDTTIIVREQPDATMDVSPRLLYLSIPPSNSDEPAHFFNLTQNVDSVLWNFGDGTTSREINPVHHYQTIGVFDVTLTVSTGYQCSDSETLRNAVTVERKGFLNCPNAFTPNLNGPTGGTVVPNDYSNDVFHCYADNLINYHLEIYNRLGIILFRSDDINIGWDGYFKGELVQEGVYTFKVTGTFNNGEKFSELGAILVIYSK